MNTSPPLTQRTHRRLRHGIAATLLVGALALSGCAQKPADEGEPAPSSSSETPSPTETLAVEKEGVYTLPVYLVASQEYAATHPPQGTQPKSCGAPLVVVNTVPVRTTDPVKTALEFLFNNEQYYHGRPQLINPAKSAGDPTVASVKTDDSTVTVTLQGPLHRQDPCSDSQLIAQLEMTAQASSRGKKARIIYQGKSLREMWGITSPYEGKDPQR